MYRRFWRDMTWPRLLLELGAFCFFIFCIAYCVHTFIDFNNSINGRFTLINGTKSSLEVCVVGNDNDNGLYYTLDRHQDKFMQTGRNLRERDIPTHILKANSQIVFTTYASDLFPDALLVQSETNGPIVMIYLSDQRRMDSNGSYSITTLTHFKPCPKWLIPAWNGKIAISPHKREE